MTLALRSIQRRDEGYDLVDWMVLGTEPHEGAACR